MNTDSDLSDPTSRRPPRGSNQNGMRQFNERVVLQAIRLHGELPKAELARVTRLSTQTISMIVNALLDEGLLLKREPLRGALASPRCRSRSIRTAPTRSASRSAGAAPT